MTDFEFDQPRARFAFSDFQGNLWIGKVDPTTGDFKPKNGKGLLVDTGTARATDFGNGPEWLMGAAGPQLVYTKYLPDLPTSPVNARVARASVVGEAWVPTFIEADVPRTSPLGSLMAGDLAPRVTYDAPASLSGGHHINFYWREIEPSQNEVVVPGTYGTLPDATRRWVPGTHTVVFSRAFTDPQGMRQIQAFAYDTDSAVLEQLTFDDGYKKEVFLWRAPEFGYEYLAFAVVNGRELRLYRKLDDGTGATAWTPINRWYSPAYAPFIWSPEPFVHNGKSYIFFVLSPSTEIVDPTAPTQLGMVTPGSANITYLTDPNRELVRADPEVFITASGPYIYYNCYAVRTDTNPGGSIGVWRVDTALGPPQ